MPIAAIPQGIELRKISAVQKRAVDELLQKQKDTSLLNTAIPSTILLIIASGAGLIYLFKDQIREWAENQVGSLAEAIKQFIVGGIVSSGGGVADIFTDTLNKVFTFNPTTPATFVDAQGNVQTLSRCQRWENDANDQLAKVQAGGLSRSEKVEIATTILLIAKNMKSEGCEKPTSISQAQWNEA